ncbi:hypothetical protein [Bacillus sp. Marseille-P3661]|nr:hypothetical protein [Bacillus sp. Marseille-P3661]
MKKKMNYLILLLSTIFIFGCTNVEDAAVTGVVTFAFLPLFEIMSSSDSD